MTEKELLELKAQLEKVVNDSKATVKERLKAVELLLGVDEKLKALRWVP